MRIEDWNVLKLIVFRENMNSSLSRSKAEEIFGKKAVKVLDRKVSSLLTEDFSNPAVSGKVEYLKGSIGRFLLFDWVVFVGVTGSVAAGTAKDSDDIDVMVVVKDGVGWLYRGLVLVKNLFSGKVRSASGENVKDKFCLNMIVEERGLKFSEDIFTFHELFYMIPVYNEGYYSQIMNENLWVRGFGGVVKKMEVGKTEKVKQGIVFFNWFLMILQIMYMFFLFHKPDLSRIIREYRDGKIMFYPKGFKEEKVVSFEERYEERMRELMEG